MLEQALSNGAQVDARDEYGATALMEAARFGHKCAVQMLLRHGASIRARAPNGRTVLMAAILTEVNEPVISELLSAGADVNAVDDDGETALMMISSFAGPKHMRVLKRLIRAGARVNAVSNDWKSALMYAAENSSEQAVTILIKNGADVNARDANGLNAIAYARQDPDYTEDDDREIIDLLVKAGARDDVP